MTVKMAQHSVMLTEVCHHIFNDLTVKNYIDETLPLYEGSKISATTSWYSLMHYAIINHLSYKAIEGLIALMQV